MTDDEVPLETNPPAPIRLNFGSMVPSDGSRVVAPGLFKNVARWPGLTAGLAESMSGLVAPGTDSVRERLADSASNMWSSVLGRDQLDRLADAATAALGERHRDTTERLSSSIASSVFGSHGPRLSPEIGASLFGEAGFLQDRTFTERLTSNLRLQYMMTPELRANLDRMARRIAPSPGSWFRPEHINNFFNMPDLTGIADAVRKRRLPSNWHKVDVDPDDIEARVDEVLDAGYPLGWVPGPAVVQALLDANSQPERRSVITTHRNEIVASCQDALITLPRALFLADMLRKAIVLYEGGHVEGAQALATNVLDTMFNQHTIRAIQVKSDVLKNVSYRKNLKRMGWRLALSLRPLATVMSGRFTIEEEVVELRRNATAHAMTQHQYSPTNAVHAIMVATSVLVCFARETPAFD